jgi:hypothetical protein
MSANGVRKLIQERKLNKGLRVKTTSPQYACHKKNLTLLKMKVKEYWEGLKSATSKLCQ